MLSVRNLSKTYNNGVRALHGVNLRIPRGLFGLLGPNGAGKSSLMRTLATLQTADSGSVTLDDLDLLQEKQAVRRVLGYLPQDFGLYPRVDALTLLDHFATLKGIASTRERRSQVESLLRLTNLWKVRKQKLGTYSGGMRQRFGIAQALLGKPELIIVDEPTTGLDPEERRRFLNLLARIGEEAVVLLSTHLVGDVRELCSQMAVIDQGEVLVQGRPDDLVEGLAGQIWSKEVEMEELDALALGPTAPDNAAPESTAQAGKVPVSASPGSASPGSASPGSASPGSSSSHSSLREATLLCSHLIGGRTVARVHCAQSPGPGFASVQANLEDVYFCVLKRGQVSDRSPSSQA